MNDCAYASLIDDSIVGNPLICGNKTTTDGCSSSAVPVPLSFSVDPAPGNVHNNF